MSEYTIQENHRKRLFTRIPFSKNVTISYGGRCFGPCRTKDLSLNGVFINGDFLGKEGDNCQVVFQRIGPGANLSVNAVAKVVRSLDDGFALEFTSMEYDSYMFLRMTLLFEPKDMFSLTLKFPAPPS